MYNQGGNLVQIKSATQTITVPLPTATPAPPTATPTPAPPTATPAPTATPVTPPSINVTDTGYVTWSFTPPAGVNTVGYVVQWNEQNHIVYNVNSYQIS